MKYLILTLLIATSFGFCVDDVWLNQEDCDLKEDCIQYRAKYSDMFISYNIETGFYEVYKYDQVLYKTRYHIHAIMCSDIEEAK